MARFLPGVFDGNGVSLLCNDRVLDPFCHRRTSLLDPIATGYPYKFTEQYDTRKKIPTKDTNDCFFFLEDNIFLYVVFPVI